MAASQCGTESNAGAEAALHGGTGYDETRLVREVQCGPFGDESQFVGNPD